MRKDRRESDRMMNTKNNIIEGDKTKKQRITQGRQQEKVI